MPSGIPWKIASFSKDFEMDSDRTIRTPFEFSLRMESILREIPATGEQSGGMRGWNVRSR